MTPPDYEKKLTFQELKDEDRFISFPLSGDNHGHGGYLGAHNVFSKTGSGSAVRLHDGIGSSCPGGMQVIKVRL